MKDRLKQFKKDHEDAIFVMTSITIGVVSGVLTSVVLNKQVDVVQVNRNNNDHNNFRIRLTNGKTSYWSIPPTA
jgi:uncharacterized protein (DUF736 family)